MTLDNAAKTYYHVFTTLGEHTMSMNIQIYALPEEKPTKCESCGHTPPYERIYFDVIQTPTDVTYSIYYDTEGVDNQLEKYKEYVSSLNIGVEEIPCFESDDIFGERGPVGYDTFDWTKDHFKKLDHFVEKWKSEGYNIIVDYM